MPGAFHAAEHHLFESRGRWLLFDVNAFTVLPSSPLDGALLAAAAAGCSRRQVKRAALRHGYGAREVADRFQQLLDHRLILGEDDCSEVVPVAEATSYSTFMVNVAQRCNLTCSYCYVAEGRFDYADRPIPRMSARTADGLVDAIHSGFPHFDTYGYHFYGGEPLLNLKVIRQIVARAEAKAKRNGTRTDYHITTNGTLITPAIADFMDQHRFQVYLSIDSDEETHDEERTYRNGRGSYQDVLRALELLKERRGVHLIGSSVIRKGVELSEAIDRLACHGASQCKAERVRLHDHDEQALTGEEHDTYIDDISVLVEHYVDALTNGRKPFDFRLSSKILGVLLKRRREFFCPGGSRMFGIAANGEIYPCALHVGRPQSLLGSIDEGLNADLQQRFRKHFSPSEQEACSHCWTRHLCGGGCSAMVDRFGHDDCAALRAESEAAITVYQIIREKDEALLFGLVSPSLVTWIRGQDHGNAEPGPAAVAP